MVDLGLIVLFSTPKHNPRATIVNVGVENLIVFVLANIGSVNADYFTYSGNIWQKFRRLCHEIDCYCGIALVFRRPVLSFLKLRSTFNVLIVH